MKKAIFCHDTYYSIGTGGNIYAYGAFPYSLWHDRFLPHFDHVTVIGREKPISADSALDKLDKSSGPNVTHILLKNINTPIKRILQGRQRFKQIKEHVKQADAIIIRGPVEFGMMAAKAARQLGKPYGVEMTGCAFDHTWYHSSLIGKFYAPIKYVRARHMVKHAAQVIYVTQNFLQKRYPANGYALGASDVNITHTSQDILQARLEKIDTMAEPITLGLIGNYGNKLKGLHIALQAMRKLKKDNIKCKLRILGKGDPEQWIPMINKLGLNDDIEFSGTLPGGQAVFDWLDAIDIYIQPSFHEGLPRAVVEAMSRGLPCLTSNAGGTDELLDSECIHNKGNVGQLYKKLKSIYLDKDWLKNQAKHNFTTASKNFDKEKLAQAYFAFWRRFKNSL